MGSLDVTALKEALLDWPSKSVPQVSSETHPLLKRLRQILEFGRINGNFESLPDLMVLIRQLLIWRNREGNIELLNVPQGFGWPDENSWSEFGICVTKTATRFLLEARVWRPNWLCSLDDDGDIFNAEHQAQSVRSDARVPMDPYLCEVTGFDDYVCPGQREAILSALYMPSGDSLIVNLPTGSGKSLVAQAPLLLHGSNAGLTLVVVPTNALALDLERRTPGSNKGQRLR